MDSYKNIEVKLHQFVRKFYINELIKGSILFFSLGFLYLFFTLFLEYFLWLKPTARTILFWIFILVEIYLLFRFILTPMFKLIGIQKGISIKESSKIIGNHFPEVGDKLLNVLQLKESGNQSDLLLASIKQKSEEIQPIPFVKAINFKKNIAYLKYGVVPVFIWLLIFITGNINVFSSSYDRVVHHRSEYIPPAPFAFTLKNQTLEVLQKASLTLQIQTTGSVTPSEVKVFYNKQEYYLQNNGSGSFSYVFESVISSIDFYVKANKVVSKNYTISVIKTPTIQNITIDLNYPKYIGKKNEQTQSTGNLLVPEGTDITWTISTKQTDSVSFVFNNHRDKFIKNSKNLFRYQKRILNKVDYQITTTNKKLKNFEKLSFQIKTIKDEYPQIEVLSDVDSLSQNFAQFAGKISDDYGLKKLEVVYYDENFPSETHTKKIFLKSTENQSFYFQFPGNIKLKKGINYEVYFQVFDNDAISGNKKSLSKVFKHKIKTAEELTQEGLDTQRNQIKTIEKSLTKRKQDKEAIKKIKEALQNKKNVNWNDKKKIQSFIKRQEKYNKMMQRQTEKLQENLKEKPNESKNIKDKKEILKKRIEELKKLEKEQRLLDEIKKLTEKLNKEDLLRKIKKLTEDNKQQERSLERILELTKRFYVEQKTMQIVEKLKKLSTKQNALQKNEKQTIENQQKIKKEFKSIQKELEELKKDNQKLKEPMLIPETKEEQKAALKQLEKSEENTIKQDKKARKKHQKNASKKMNEIRQKLQQAMNAMEGEMKEENEKSLRIILKNLLNFSFKQESLMKSFSKIDVSHPSFGKELKMQNTLKTYFEHIDDSIYMLSMRLPKISTKIQKDLSSAHYNINESLENFSENKFRSGFSNQQYVMTAANNLADFLSAILENMQKPRQSKAGKGKKGGKQFSLPDIIKKQSDLIEKMKQGEKQGKGKGSNGKNSQGKGEGLDGELYRIYQEQAQLREELKNAIKKGENGNPAAAKILKSMEQLENEILEKGFNINTIERMQQLQYNLLKLDKATFEQEKDIKRKSTTNQLQYFNKNSDIFIKKMFYNQTEILNRQSLPLQKNYKKKVQEYFRKTKVKEVHD